MKIKNSLIFLFCVLVFTLNAQSAFDLASGYLQNTGKYAPSDLEDITITDEYSTNHNDIIHLYLKQRFQGIDVIGSNTNFNIKDGQILSVNEKLISDLAQHIETAATPITAAQALQIVMEKHDLIGSKPTVLEVSSSSDKKTIFAKGNIAHDDIIAKLVYLPSSELLKLSWEISLYEKSCQNSWLTYVDAQTGEILKENNQVIHCAFHSHKKHSSKPKIKHLAEITLVKNAMVVANSYNVYAYPVESPNHGDRTLQISPWLDAGLGGTLGWHDDGTSDYTTTKGNNTDAYEDQDATNGPTGDDAARAEGGVDLEFDFDIDLSDNPEENPDPYITNLFYWNNLMHDVWYQYGFNEAAGNFQEDNLGRGGLGGDYVNAEAQDGSGSNNANFNTPVDGSNPRMQMFLWTPADPDDPELDSDLDNGIIAHEYGHGISIRLTGGPANSSCLNNAEQMGEGWSDFFGLWMTIEPGDFHEDIRGVGTYVEDQDTDGDGIRPAPYTTDMTINDYTYGNVADGDISQPHGIGFIWCTMIWELNWAFVNVTGLDHDLYTGAGGNNYCARVIIDAMKLQPCSPGFVDARDAIIDANTNLGGIGFTNVIWNVFARRGLGFSADQGSSANRSDQTEAFDLPPGVPSMTDEELFGAAPLPVALTAFNAVANNKNQTIELFWSTETEENNKGFELQRRSDYNSEFKVISWLPGNANATEYSNYFYTDEEVRPGEEYYYRLNQLDLNDRANISDIVNAKLDGLSSEIHVFPNPSKGISSIQFSNEIRGIVQMQILNAQGQVIGEQLFDTTGNAELEVDLNGMPEGVYFLKFEIGGEQFVKSLVLKR